LAGMSAACLGTGGLIVSISEIPTDMSAWGNRLRQPIRTLFFRVARQIPVLRALLAELNSARETFRFAPAGHYYSPIPAPDAIREHAARSHAAPAAELPGISLNERRQLELLDALKLYYKELPFPESK